MVDFKKLNEQAQKDMQNGNYPQPTYGAGADDSKKREIAYRVFAKEMCQSHVVLEKDAADQYAPNYLLTPTGAKVNRVYFVGVLMEKKDIGTDTQFWRGVIADPTGTINVYAGRQYQPEAAAMMEHLENKPQIVSVVGKISYREDEAGNGYTSIKPEYIAPANEAEKAAWTLETIRATIARIKEVRAGTNPLQAQLQEEYGDAEKAFTDGDVKEYKEMLKTAALSLKAGAVSEAPKEAPEKKTMTVDKKKKGQANL